MLVLDEHTMGVLALFLRFCSLLGFGEHIMLDICLAFVNGGGYYCFTTLWINMQ